MFLPQYPGSDLAPAPRTLIDILQASAAAHPEAPALDDGERSLTYAELLVAIDEMAGRLRAAGLGAGDRIGIRIPSGTRELYIGILATMTIGAAYVPVDADDPEERARAGLRRGQGRRGPGRQGKITVPARDAEPGTGPGEAAPGRRRLDHLHLRIHRHAQGRGHHPPLGRRIRRRRGRIFLQDEPLGPEDRVLAGLSVAFDASCEEMWLAWRHGACLVPAPRVAGAFRHGPGSLAGTHGITVVSTVPTLAALWPAEALENVRLLIFGGEACPPELAARLAVAGREVWNTYGPTEATVVACAAPMDGTDPVRIGLPLDGWDLAVVDAAGDARAPRARAGN